MDATTAALVNAVRLLLDDHRRVDPHHEDICLICKAAEAALAAANK